MAEDFGMRLKALRQEAGFTQKEMGDKFGIDRSTITSYEIGKSYPDIVTLRNIADYFDVSLDWLTGRDDDRRSFRRKLLDAVKDDPELTEFVRAMQAGGHEIRVAFRHIKDLTPDKLQTLVRVAKAFKEETSGRNEN